MTTLLVAKQYIKSFISKYEVYLQPMGKLILALTALLVINGKIGYMAKVNNIFIVLIVALMCSFMPANFIIIVSALFVLLHFYAITLECAIVGLVIFLVMFLLYFRFSPKDTLVVLLTPICFVLKIPYVIPLVMGLVGTPSSVVSVGCGVVVYFLISYVADHVTALSGMAADDIATKFGYVIDGILNNKAMMVTIAAFAITIIIVYVIRRMSIDHAWTIATVGGALANVMILLVGDLLFDTKVSIVGAVIGTLVSIGIVKVVEFFVFNVDYSRTEVVQFEDDEYYYYVKAVPKVTMATPSRTVKKINTPKRRTTGSSQHRN